MLNANTFKTAAEVAVNHGLAYAPVPGSILGQLVDKSQISDFFHPTSISSSLSSIIPNTVQAASPLNLDLDYLANDVEYVTRGSSDGPSEHSRAMATHAEDLARLLTQHSEFARSVVAPRVIAFREAMERSLESMRNPAIESQFSVVKEEVPELFRDESFITMTLKPYIDSNRTTSDIGWADAKIQEIDIDQFMTQLLNFGSERLNEMANRWMKSLPDGFFVYVLSTVFNGPWTEKTDGVYKEMCARQDSQWRESAFMRLNTAMAAYLIADYFLKNPVGTSGTKENYIQELGRVRNTAGETAVTSLRVITTQIANRSLVIEANMNQKTVYVHASLYRDWLTKGGSPEVLFGMLTSGQVQYSCDVILEQKERLLESWNNYCMVATSSARSALVTNFEQFIEASAVQSLLDLTEAEKDFMKGCPGYIKKVEELIKYEMRKHHGRIIENLGHFCIELMAKCRFYFTSAYKILHGMECAAEHNPDITPEEAAFLSMANYVSDYLASMIIDTEQRA